MECNIVAKGEIAHFEQFLLLSLCFQKTVCLGSNKHPILDLKSCPLYLVIPTQAHNDNFCNNVFNSF